VYTIKHAAELTGVPVATLRAWERRYGVVTPRRTDSGYRLYDERSLNIITAIRDLVAAGWSAQQAATEVKRRQTNPVPQPAAGVVAAPGAQASDHPFAELVAAAADLDPIRLANLLDDQFSRGSFEAVVDGWLMPALDEIGQAWADGRISVAGEHLVAHAIGRRLAAAYDAAARDPRGVSVIVGLPPGAHHELGILAFATAARRVGLATTYLGADLPAQDWLTAVTRHRPRCAVLSLAREHDLNGLTAVAALVKEAHPHLHIVVGGRYQHLAPEGTSPLGHNIAAAATRLAQDLTD
jgi:DNA-binding transcriptional MerR regulator/methylmalonyl-CoA mutase cobalamin-binding subunit